MANLKLDAANWDIGFDTNGQIEFVYDDDAIVQTLKFRLQKGLGEWFRDLNAGTDWFGAILGKRSDLSIRAEVRRVINGTDGVQEMRGLTYTRNRQSRRLENVSFEAIKEDGRPLDVRFEQLTPGGS